jgi:hypothetical protein
MAIDRDKIFGAVRAVVFLAMGVIICTVEPHAIRENPDAGFLNFTRYLIGVLLVFGGAKRLYRLFFARENKDSLEE